MANVEHRDETLALATEGHLMVACWWAAPTGPQMRVVEKIAGRHQLERRQTGFAQFIFDGSPKFPAEVRQIARRLTDERFALGIAHVVEVDGIRGAAARTFLSGLTMMRGGDKPVKVFRSADEGAHWLGPHLTRVDDPWPATRILALRQSLSPRT